MDGTTRWLSTSGQLSCPSHTRWHRANRPDNRSLDIRGRVGGVATGRVTPPVGFVLRPAIRQRCVPDRASGSSRSHPPPHQVGWRVLGPRRRRRHRIPSGRPQSRPAGRRVRNSLRLCRPAHDPTIGASGPVSCLGRQLTGASSNSARPAVTAAPDQSQTRLFSTGETSIRSTPNMTT